MRIRIAAFLLMSAALPGTAIPASAALAQTAPAESQAQQDFTLVNNSGHTVMALNVSPADEKSWGPNILGGDKLANGESVQITFSRGETQCDWDIRATYDDGGTTDERKVNLCEVATVTLTAN